MGRLLVEIVGEVVGLPEVGNKDVELPFVVDVRLVWGVVDRKLAVDFAVCVEEEDGWVVEQFPPGTLRA